MASNKKSMLSAILMLQFPDFSNPTIWISLLTLTFLEIVLGIDNIIFISIVASKLERKDQARVTNIVLTDVQCSNGIIHAVNKVLLPTL